jgi:hypothetical protein
MRRILLPLFLLAVIPLAVAQTKSAPAFQVGTIIAVTDHQPAPEGDVHLYDVSVQVGDTVYVVLYDPHPDSTIATYRLGAQVVVAVGKDTVTFSDLLGRHRAFSILHVEPAPKKN